MGDVKWVERVNGLQGGSRFVPGRMLKRSVGEMSRSERGQRPWYLRGRQENEIVSRFARRVAVGVGV